jgi:methyl-accepting chemotaxis protein
MKLSSPKVSSILIFWASIGVIGISFFCALVIYLFGELSGNFSVLEEEVFPIQQLEQFYRDASLQEQFNEELDKLAAVLPEKHQAFLQSLHDAFDAFNRSGRQLIAKKQQYVQVENDIDSRVKALNEKIQGIQIEIDSLAGKAKLKTKRQERKLKKLLKQEALTLTEMLPAVEGIVGNGVGKFSARTERVRVAAGQLRESILTIQLSHNADVLVSLRDNVIKQSLQVMTGSISDMQMLDVDIDALSSILSSLDSTINEIRKELVEAETGLVDTRIQQIHRESSLVAQQASLADHKQQLLALVNELNMISTTAANQSITSSKAAMSNSQLILILTSVFAIIVTVVLGSLVYTRIAGSLRYLSGIMRQVAVKDLRLEVVSTRDDEFGELTTGVQQTVNNFSDALRQVYEAVGQIRQALQSLVTNTEHTMQGVDTQFAESETLASAMSQLAQSVDEVAQSAVNTSDATQKATDEAEQSNAFVKRTVNDISALASEVENASGVIAGLEKDTNKIGSVLEVIQGISEQTNLLALNAAIEAARAGEAGRGFAVVADEVRALAQKTRESTLEIQEIIQTIQSASQNATDAISKSSHSAENCALQARDVGSSIEHIVSQVHLVNKMNLQIASAAEEQSCVTNEMNTSIMGIRKVSEETAKGAQEVDAHAKVLEEQIMRLNQLLLEYQLR